MTGNHPDAATVSPLDPRVLTLAATLAAMLAGMYAGWQAIRDLEPARHGAAAGPALTPITAHSAEQLADRLNALGYDWPPGGPVPRIHVRAFPHDLDTLSVDRRKAVFFRSILPLVLRENAGLRQQRGRLQGLLGSGALPPPDSPDGRFLQRMQERFRVSGDPGDAEVRRRLLRRVDTVPPALALAQAANESGWGTSRFTREGNNLFGEWTYQPGEGMMPARREEGATHRVRVFADLQASVRGYMHNLNAGSAYAELRRRRARARAQGGTPDGLDLAGGLLRYSERGEAYVREIRAMIRQNDLHRLPALELADTRP
ncbi:glucosaminidase domain-containing protein [Aquisalimonas lutea]|uniref:glucosaminidase domain-containing protein n=1 Tax=Aquisalimonas lutea TaxID=1327750 RepID=UPI0025B5F9B8|nr:glucosaminidase domain-containing protein [Aquisalimonas lutea]MDN3516957.1 glucosaminidase domain-containing protein [Aquisalimonas lutea]